MEDKNLIIVLYFFFLVPLVTEYCWANNSANLSASVYSNPVSVLAEEIEEKHSLLVQKEKEFKAIKNRNVVMFVNFLKLSGLIAVVYIFAIGRKKGRKKNKN